MAENENSFAFTSRERCAALDTEDPTYDGLAAVTAQRQNYNAIRTLDGARPATDAEILNGILTLTGYARIVVDTEGQAPADDLLTIPTVSTDENGASIDLCPDGAIIYLKAKDASRAITVKNSQNEYGIRTYSGSDLALRADAWLELRLEDGTWCVESPIVTVATTEDTGVVKPASDMQITSEGVLSDKREVLYYETMPQGGLPTTGIKNGAVAFINDMEAPSTPTAEELIAKYSRLPIGSVIPSMSDLTPYGFLYLNGGTFAVSAFPDLARALGAPEGATTFTLPNGIGRVLWGSDTAGQLIEAGLPNIEATAQVEYGGFTDTGTYTGALSAKNSGTSLSSTVNGSNPLAQNRGMNFDASHSNPIYGASNTVQPPALTVRFYVKAYDVALSESEAQVGELIDSIQACVKLDGSNLRTDTTVKTVVETWHEGTEWYRVWSDGWIEQGGRFSYVSSNATYSAVFAKVYTLTPSILYSSIDMVYKNTDTNTTNTITEISTTGFSLYCQGGRGQSTGWTWYACGY